MGNDNPKPALSCDTEPLPQSDALVTFHERVHAAHNCLVALLMVGLLSSCVTTQGPGALHSDVWNRTDLEGRSLAAAFERLGSATIYDKITPANELGGEFYTPVNDRFPPDAARSRKILIREVRWQRQWGRWQVFDAVEWQKSVQF